jgi:ribosomal protein S27E
MSDVRTITAKYDGRCAECNTRSCEGDTVVYDTVERKVYCEDCGEDLK